MNLRLLSRRALGRVGLGATALLATAQTTAEAAEPGAVWTAWYAGKRVWGFANRHSVAAGEPFALTLATGPGVGSLKGKVEIRRIGTSLDNKVFTGPTVTIAERLVQATSAATGLDWPETVAAIPTRNWTSGYYTVDFAAEDGRRESDVAFIVVTNPNPSGGVLVVIGTSTFAAYNKWGGHSLYESATVGSRGQMVSFDRPQSPDFFDYDRYLVQWLETVAKAERFPVDYATNFDIHSRPGMLAAYGLVIYDAHNEYWTQQEHDALYGRIFKDGKNVIFYGANTGYWRVRYSDINAPEGAPDWGRQLICYKSPGDPVGLRTTPEAARRAVTALFRDTGYPETTIAGVGFQDYFHQTGPGEPRYPYIVARTDLPFFEGTGWKIGDVAADVVGYEWDAVDPLGNGARLSRPGDAVPPIPLEAIKILFSGAPVGVKGTPGKAEAVYFETGAGAKVFSSSSVRWAWGLAKPQFENEPFKRFNRNLLLDFLKPPKAGRPPSTAG